MDHLITKEHKPLFPYEYSKSQRILGVDINGEVHIFSENELSSLSIQEFYSAFPGKNFVTTLCSPNEFEKGLTKLYSQDKLQESIGEELSESFDLESYAKTITPSEDLLQGSNDAPIIKLINGILSQAIKAKASDIHFEPYEDAFIVRLRIDGVMRELISQDSRLSPPIVSRLKIMSKLDIAERRKPQDGRVSLSLGPQSIDVRVSTLPSSYGERVVLRLLDKDSAEIDLNNLGFSDYVNANYRKALKSNEGIILVTGPTGSGKTTTLYAGLREINDNSQNILTVEDPVEYTLAGVGQTQVNTRSGYTFASGLRSILRQDPDIVMVGEIRDSETASIAIQASLTGHLVLSTIHTNSAIGAIARLRDMGVESYLLASSIRVVLAQRLVRRLCNHCKKPSEENTNLLTRFNLSSDKSYYEASGCQECSFTGYSGRLAIAELVEVDETLKQMIHDGASEKMMNDYAFQNNQSIQESIKLNLENGITSIGEIVRLQNISDA